MFLLPCSWIRVPLLPWSWIARVPCFLGHANVFSWHDATIVQWMVSTFVDLINTQTCFHKVEWFSNVSETIIVSYYFSTFRWRKMMTCWYIIVQWSHVDWIGKEEWEKNACLAPLVGFVDQLMTYLWGSENWSTKFSLFSTNGFTKRTDSSLGSFVEVLGSLYVQKCMWMRSLSKMNSFVILIQLVCMSAVPWQSVQNAFSDEKRGLSLKTVQSE